MAKATDPKSNDDAPTRRANDAAAATRRPSDAVTAAWIALMRAQQVAMRRAERALRRAELPAYGWYDALWELEKAGEDGLRIGEIEQQMLVAQSNVSRLVDRLEAASCIVRRPCPTDGRAQLIVITDAGRAVRARMWPIYAEVIQSVVGDHVNDADASLIAAILAPVIADRGD
ncbi:MULTISPECIES: MarR family winged helix-turn-helix transcriptional regulator [unclassified Sphingopyxis]|uniref:MarR family winged helix-turn-helix transcriptional regulator n=1 Tax=unclassified Sphingopyxis TaxID=2614943 RepID=UPI0009E71EAD|nr:MULTISPECIES: MarR family winged helix-turn-helix transcriptional regulator [unclassified Sphingopyxis]